MEHAAPIDGNALTAGTGASSAASDDDLSWAVVKMRAGERIVVNDTLIAAYQAASSPHSIRAPKPKSPSPCPRAHAVLLLDQAG